MYIAVSKKPPMEAFANWCRMLSSNLRSGISLKSSLATLAEKGQPATRELSSQLLACIESGKTFGEAIKENKDRVPQLAIALSRVSDETGHLPELLRELEKFIRFQIKLRRQFISQITMPVLQLVAAVLIIALVIWILGIIENPQRGPTPDMLGLGLKGERGAFIWLASCASIVFFLWASHQFLRFAFGQGKMIDTLVLRIPVIGECARLLAMARLCVALELTLDSGMSPKKSVPLALETTSNEAFAATKDPILASIKQGYSLTDSFAPHRLFPDDFHEILSSAEESGNVPESMGRLATEYGERAEHQLQVVNTMAGWGVWLVVAGIIIFFIFRIFSNYVAMLNDAMK